MVGPVGRAWCAEGPLLNPDPERATSDGDCEARVTRGEPAQGPEIAATIQLSAGAEEGGAYESASSKRIDLAYPPSMPEPIDRQGNHDDPGTAAKQGQEGGDRLVLDQRTHRADRTKAAALHGNAERKGQSHRKREGKRRHRRNRR